MMKLLPLGLISLVITGVVAFANEALPSPRSTESAMVAPVMRSPGSEPWALNVRPGFRVANSVTVSRRQMADGSSAAKTGRPTIDRKKADQLANQRKATTIQSTSGRIGFLVDFPCPDAARVR